MNGLFFRTTSETKLHFTLPTVESNVNRIYFMAGWNFITSLRWTHLRMFTWDFISSEIIFFNSVFQNCLHEIPRNETHHGCYLTAVIFMQNFTSGDICYVSTIPKLSHPKGNICACVYFMKTEILNQNIKQKWISFHFARNES